MKQFKRWFLPLLFASGIIMVLCGITLTPHNTSLIIAGMVCLVAVMPLAITWGHGGRERNEQEHGGGEAAGTQ